MPLTQSQFYFYRHENTPIRQAYASNKKHYTQLIILMALNFVFLKPNSLGALELVPPFLVIPVPCLNCEQTTMRLLQLIRELIKLLHTPKQVESKTLLPPVNFDEWIIS